MTIVTLLIALIATPSGDAAGELVLLDFHASWCGPCQQMRPAIDLLVERGYPVKSVDVDDSADLAARYKVRDVPTFIVVDASGQPLAQLKGAQPAGKLARMYLDAKAKLKPAAPDREPRDEGPDDRDDPPPAIAAEDEPADDRAPAAPAAPTNPKPWETAVRIKVHDGPGSTGYGSGTIIHSTAEESIILTCAHIFKLDGRQQAHPSRFPRRITVDLFDGNLKAKTVHYANETYDGKAIDYDFDRDVGLIRIRPGRKLPASRVVPTHWKPQAQMLVTTVGCSEGHDATTWDTTIVNPAMRGLSGNPHYEAIECLNAPKRGRSGGGLYTSDGYVAGVCDFAEPQGNHGLYATPTSIRHILDRNNLMACYAPVSRKGQPQTLLASNDRTPPRRKPETAIARAQSPDRDESNLVTIPPPDLLGIKAPATARAAPTTTRSSSGWHATPVPKLASRADTVVGRDQTRETDLMLDPALDSDHFSSTPGDARPKVENDERAEEQEVARKPATPARPPSKWRPVRTPMTALSPSP